MSVKRAAGPFNVPLFVVLPKDVRGQLLINKKGMMLVTWETPGIFTRSAIIVMFLIDTSRGESISRIKILICQGVTFVNEV